MNTLELFCGTKSFSKVAGKLGHNTHTIDNEMGFAPDQCANVTSKLDIECVAQPFDVIWASPPCTAFSVASIGTHWKGGHRAYEPATDAARDGIRLVKDTLAIIREHNPTWWFIENPRGVLRKMPFMQESRHVRRVTVTYCQYGDKRMKPTDIWTNAWWWDPKPVCKNGAPCHVRAPRGAKTGTQGLKGARERGVVPPAIFHEIFKQMPKDGE